MFPAVDAGEFGHDVVELDDDFGVGGPAVGDGLEVGGVPLAHDGNPFGQDGQGGGSGVGVQGGPAGGGRSFGVVLSEAAGYLVDPGGQFAFGGFQVLVGLAEVVFEGGELNGQGGEGGVGGFGHAACPSASGEDRGQRDGFG